MYKMPEIFSIEERINLIKRFGNSCMAYSTLQPGISYYDLPGAGYLAFTKQGRTRFVLGNPICDREKMVDLIRGALREHPQTSFYQISRDVAEILHKEFGFNMNLFGTETGIYKKSVWPSSIQKIKSDKEILEKQLEELKNQKDEIYDRMGTDEHLRKKFWKIKTKYQKVKKKLLNQAYIDPSYEFVKEYLKGSKKEVLRRQYSTAVSSGVKVFEESPENWNKEVLEQISKEWITTRMVSSDEMKFFTRPLNVEFDSNNDVRLFVAKKDGETIGYILIDPIFENHKIKGYFADIIRTRKDAPTGTGYLLIIESMKNIFHEGFDEFNLGLSPFHRIVPVYLDKDGKQVRVDNLLMTNIFKFSFNYGSFLYNSKDQAFHKERFRGIVYPTYACTNKKFPVGEIMDAFRASGIYPYVQLKEFVKRQFIKN